MTKRDVPGFPEAAFQSYFVHCASLQVGPGVADCFVAAAESPETVNISSIAVRTARIITGIFLFVSFNQDNKAIKKPGPYIL
jgi:hypothetical protein